MSTDSETSRRILVVDDDEVMRELLSALLEVQGYEVLAVESGLAALQVLKDPEAPKLILTDLQMPGLEGEALTSSLREAAATNALLLGMSGAQPSEGALRSLDSFLSKPFNSTQLEAAIEGARAARDARGMDALPAGAKTEAGGSKESTSLASGVVLDEEIFSALSKTFRAEQLHELYNMTLDDVLQRQGRMLGHAEAGDLGAVQREAHAIKGSCGFVGARELQGLAASVEGGTTLDTSAIGEFTKACERLRRMLDAKLQQ